MTIPIYCFEEKVIVGHLDLTSTMKLTSEVLMRCYFPVGDTYRLHDVPRRGSVLPCPRCGHALAIKGSFKTYESEQIIETDGVPIIIGVTKVGMQ